MAYFPSIIRMSAGLIEHAATSTRISPVPGVPGSGTSTHRTTCSAGPIAASSAAFMRGPYTGIPTPVKSGVRFGGTNNRVAGRQAEIAPAPAGATMNSAAGGGREHVPGLETCLAGRTAAVSRDRGPGRCESQPAHRAWLVSSAVLIALLPGGAQAFCGKSGDGSKCHPQIVQESLGFLRPGILQALARHVNDPDEWDKPRFIVDQWRRMNYATDDHFDNCNFDGGVEKINDRYLRKRQDVPGILEALSPHRRRLKSGSRGRFADEDYPRLFQAGRQWAWVLHAAQDLYSHSNWVELGFTDPARDLVDPGRGSWAGIPSDWHVVRSDVIAAQRPLPPNWKMEFLPLPDPSWPPKWAAAAKIAAVQGELDAQAKQPVLGERVPHVTDENGKRFRLLITGHGPVPNPWNTCPLARLIGHDDLNKDNRTRRWHYEASRMAIGQTRHEWCRLLHLAHSENAAAGAAVLMGLMANPGDSPHPPGTLCAPARAGGIEVIARVTQILVSDGKEDAGSGQLNLVFAGFTPDFQRSARTQATGVAIRSGARVQPG